VFYHIVFTLLCHACNLLVIQVYVCICRESSKQAFLCFSMSAGCTKQCTVPSSLVHLAHKVSTLVLSYSWLSKCCTSVLFLPLAHKELYFCSFLLLAHNVLYFSNFLPLAQQVLFFSPFLPLAHKVLDCSCLMFRTLWSRSRDVVLVGRTIDLGCWEFGMGREWGGQFTSNLGPRWMASHHTKGGIPSK
jgi:hypothetical protein